ncbi:Ig-like domain-containing protein [Bacillus sp. EB01]|uniref:Ig-like domain-containing protein n=1 Tax=Bacillus sp. EB01 TaxID=1347086 RepID=UPI000693D908|nr:Ig-like domain-containing protein [Bacillus sp. EB01]
MKRVFFVLVSFVLLASMFITPQPIKIHAETNGTQGFVKKLGVPHYTIGIFSSAYGEGPNGTKATFVASGGVFNVINTVTGERMASHKLNNTSSIWGITVDPSGLVYLADTTNLFRYDPQTDVLEDLGRATETEAATWGITSDEKGRIFGGTWPNGKVFMYDPETDAFTDFGTMAEGAGYARDVQVYNGKLYVGVGIEQHLIEYDLATGEKTEILLPEENQDEGTPYDVDIRGDYLITRLANSSSLLVYDLVNKAWVDEITQAKGSMVSPPDKDNKVYFHKGTTLHSYDLDTLELSATELNDTWSSKGFGWIELDEPGFEGLNLTSLRFNGTYWIYNPTTGQSKEITAQIEGQPISIHSIALGPDGNIYSSGYHSGGFAYYSPTDDKITSFTGFGQGEGIIATEDYLYLGVYPGANIYQYDPTRPYEHDPTVPEKQTNPKVLFSLKGMEQDRPFAWAEGDGHVFVGTVPDYGVLGGTLSIINEATGEHETFRNVVQDQSIISLQYKDGLIYGGTSVYGGLDSKPTAEDAKLFIFDPETKEKVYEGTPIPGERGIGTLEFDDEGYLWGMTQGKIFKFDPESREVLQSKELFSYSWEGISHFWRGPFLDFDEDGNFYGSSLGKLFKFNPDNWELEILDDKASLYAKDEEGNIYFARGAELFVYVRDSDAPDVPTVLNPVAPLSTNNRSPEITVETEPGAKVIIIDKGEEVGISEADETGIAVIKTKSLTKGIHKMKAYVVDKAGNESDMAAIPHIIINNGKKPK